MKYEAVYLYNNRNEFVGVAIKKTDAPQLQSINIWSDNPEDIEDFKRTLTSLNDEDFLRKFWPDASDKEVTDLVEDPTWEPLTLKKDSVVDYDASTIVFAKEPVWGYEFSSTAGPIGPDGLPEGGPVPKANPDTGVVEWKETQEIDREASTFVHKEVMAPDPMEVQERFFKAQEIVARRRAVAFDVPA